MAPSIMHGGDGTFLVTIFFDIPLSGKVWHLGREEFFPKDSIFWSLSQTLPYMFDVLRG
jgi:hypothetical protein